jgi:hypothetical protein
VEGDVVDREVPQEVEVVIDDLLEHILLHGDVSIANRSDRPALR